VKYFIGRYNELTFLEKSLVQKKSSFIPIYGRRRVGKSELILQFLKNKKALYYVGQQTTGQIQLNDFMREASRVLDQPHISELSPDRWEVAFETVINGWPTDTKIIIALDEFQWIASSSPEILSTLQRLWDQKWQHDTRVMLIVCGSYIGFMENEVLGKKSPLFGRRTGQILLRPFSYQEAALFHPNYSHIDHVRTYGICGGIPLYLKYFDSHRSVEMNIIDTFLQEQAPLFREADFLLREELREVERYYAILESLASQSRSTTDIALYTGLEVRSLTYYLNQLIGLGYIRKNYPLTGMAPSVKSVKYTVRDPLLKFWFRFIFPSVGSILRAGAKSAFNQLIKPLLPAYMGTQFEGVCRCALEKIYFDEGVASEFEIGEYWNKDVQIDIVGIRGDNVTDICECKFGTVRSPGSIEKELRQKTVHFANPRNATIFHRIFARKKPSGNTSMEWYGIDDLYT
jgi:hypothetical protein